ncbi:4-demethylwyosine synthase TYW1 [Conexivisphaera calida]|uniref:4-demethylwyosine synthase TYW1 n=1 Tax=Conexivisphaera calida TaxID=1874277 RepID=UPI001E2D2769|nr:4-demethylwyosine synthase TYW1 [Conexivisphaera calida]
MESTNLSAGASPQLESVRPGYMRVGRNSAVEICRWTRSALLGKRMCYKRWYGVYSHRCIQMTPNVGLCDFECPFCWRPHGRRGGPISWDGPAEIVDGIIDAQRRLLVGYKGNPLVDGHLFLEAMFPRHVAISLDGEPAMYPWLRELVSEIRGRGMTAFLVTNGSVPGRLRGLRGAPPHNLYVSLYGPSEEVFERSARPLFRGAWERVMESLSMMGDFEDAGSNTLLRLTMVRGLNMVDPDGYSRVIGLARPMFVELKGYTWVGESTRRLTIDAMPTLGDLESFAAELESRTGYRTADVDGKSRVVMLARGGEALERARETASRLRSRIAELDEQWRKNYAGADEFRLVRAQPPPWPGGWI